MGNLLKLGLFAVCLVAGCSSTRDSLLGGGGAGGFDALPEGRCDGPPGVLDGAIVCNPDGDFTGERCDGSVVIQNGVARCGGDGGTNDPCDGAAVVIVNGQFTCNFTGPGGAGGMGGAGGAAGGGGGSTGTAGSGGSGGWSCATAECARPYKCVRSCGGPVESYNCCACQAPLFDDFGATACGGTGGATAGSGGSPRGGSGGSAGSGGSGGSPRGGSGGNAGSAGSLGSGGGCDNSYVGVCLRPYECIATCGGPLVTNNCCPCEAPLFDNFGDVACRAMGTPTVTYAGCRYIGGYNRIAISRKDSRRDLCVNVVLVEPGPPPSGLTLWSNSFGVESVSGGPASACPTRNVLPISGGTVKGTVTSPQGTTALPSSVSFDLTVSVPLNDVPPTGNEVLLSATNVDTSGACP